MGVRLALYAEVAARCCWSWAAGYLAQLLHFDKISFQVGCTALWRGYILSLSLEKGIYSAQSVRSRAAHRVQTRHYLLIKPVQV